MMPALCFCPEFTGKLKAISYVFLVFPPSFLFPTGPRVGSALREIGLDR
jgi:hypothetical protein